MKVFTTEDFTSKLYPAAAQRKQFGKRDFPWIFEEAKETADGVSLIGLRLDLLRFVRTFNSEARDIWKQDARMYKVASIILKRALDP